MSNKTYQQNPISEVTITANSIELDIDKNYIIPNMNGEVAFLLCKPEAKKLVTVLNEFLMYQNGDGPEDDKPKSNPNKRLLDKCIQHNRDGWNGLVQDAEACRKLQKDQDVVGLQIAVTKLAMDEADFLDESRPCLSQNESSRIANRKFLTYYANRVKDEADKQLDREAA